MPIEIKELNIKINVEGKKQNEDLKKAEKDDKNAIIEACVEQVMEILSKTRER